MGQWPTKYTDQQRGALEDAYFAKPRPARLIRERAERGELTFNGETVPPFKVPDSTIRDLGRAAVRRRRGEQPSPMVELAHVDAVEVLRRRLVALCDGELARLERDANGGRRACDLESARKVGRVLRELAALPDPKDARAPAAGPRTTSPGQSTDLGELVRRSLRGQAPSASTANDPPVEGEGRDAHTSSPHAHTGEPDTAPGIGASGQAAGFRALEVRRRPAGELGRGRT